MPTLREVRRRIGGVQKTQKITRAMKMVAAAKLRRAQSRVVTARPYARAIRDLLGDMASGAAAQTADLMAPRDVRKLRLVVITSDRGFCGAFNSNLIKAAQAHVASQASGVTADLVCVGRKGVDFFGRRGYRLAGRHPGVFTALTYGWAQSLGAELIAAFRKGEVDRVDVIYNEFKSIAQSRIVIEQYLPVPPPPPGTAPKRPIDYIYEPDRPGILAALIPRHLSAQLWRMLLESSAAEEGARMAAMENATENAREMIATLQLQYNKARQAAITKELLEVVSGAEALRG